jgi:hypothetical protein
VKRVTCLRSRIVSMKYLVLMLSLVKILTLFYSWRSVSPLVVIMQFARLDL